MHIVNIASELAPLAKVGGLADVVHGLSRELALKGHSIDVIIPKYDCMDTSQVRDLGIDYYDLSTTFEGESFHNTIWMGWVENIKVYFIEPHHPALFFNRGCFYGCEDDTDRYLYFCRAAMDFLLKRKIMPDIIHIHDWQTAAIAPLYKKEYQSLFKKPVGIVFTIHNLEYQGKAAPFNLDSIGLEFTPDLVDPKDETLVNLLKGALLNADYITTVSPNYAWEITTAEGGRDLDSILSKLSNFSGILNGIDYSYWNPELDRYLPAHYSHRIMPQDRKDRATLDKKAFIKKTLRERLLLSEEHRPIVGCITRLVPQKGIELIKHALDKTLELGGQFVLLGSSPIPAINQEFHELKAKYTEHPNVHLVLHHQEELAHLIFAGSDIFIVPSLFEPCGLTQMIALKYGTPPVVRKTGGLADTIFDVDYSEKPFEETNGYVFDFPDFTGVDSALDRAIPTWFHEPEKWRKLMVQGMCMDYSWAKSSEEYLKIYNIAKGEIT